MDAAALLADLDPDQRTAVTAESHLVAVIAGAGSGKTRVLTRRIAWRIATEQADARHTLALTFTREAAGELRRRLTRLGMRERVEAGTFHSVMLAILKQRWDDTGRPAKTIVADRRRLVGDVLEPSQRRGIDGLINEIDWATARGVSADRYSATARREGRKPHAGVERAATVFGDFELLKRKRGIIDFDDVLALVIRDMEYDREFADTLRWRFRHLLVDEAQDLNPLQHRLVDLLRTGRDDLFLVGDPAQAIYGFNGADPALLVDVETRFPGVEVVRLPLNHRCTPQIVRAGVHVLAAASQPNELVSHRGDGAPVEQFVGADEAAEARHAADESASESTPTSFGLGRWPSSREPTLSSPASRKRSKHMAFRFDVQRRRLAHHSRQWSARSRRSAQRLSCAPGPTTLSMPTTRSRPLAPNRHLRPARETSGPQPALTKPSTTSKPSGGWRPRCSTTCAISNSAMAPDSGPGLQ